MFEWRDLLPLAERLAVEAHDEAAGRTAIGRAYYAAYHAAAAFVREAGLLSTRHTHWRVWTALTGDPNPERVRVGRLGDQLRRRRVEADYQNPFPGNLAERAGAAVGDPRDVIETLDRLG